MYSPNIWPTQANFYEFALTHISLVRLSEFLLSFLTLFICFIQIGMTILPCERIILNLLRPCSKVPSPEKYFLISLSSLKWSVLLLGTWSLEMWLLRGRAHLRRTESAGLTCWQGQPVKG